MAKATTTQSSNTEAVIDHAKERRANWKVLHSRWNRSFYIGGLSAMALPAIIEALPRVLVPPKGLIPLLSVLAVLTVGFVAFANPSKQARAYIAAWRLLNDKLLDYELTGTPEAVKEVKEAINEGEKILAGKDPY
jgi:uncharacterized membrane protein YdbT with pleckstrin-like domain